MGEASSSLGASSLKNLSAVRGCHSFSETVFLLSLSLLGLVCSLHFCTSLLKNINVLSRIWLYFSRIHTKAEYIIAEKNLFVKRVLKFSYKVYKSYIYVLDIFLTFC